MTHGIRLSEVLLRLATWPNRVENVRALHTPSRSCLYKVQRNTTAASIEEGNIWLVSSCVVIKFDPRRGGVV